MDIKILYSKHEEIKQNTIFLSVKPVFFFFLVFTKFIDINAAMKKNIKLIRFFGL